MKLLLNMRLRTVLSTGMILIGVSACFCRFDTKREENRVAQWSDPVIAGFLVPFQASEAPSGGGTTFSGQRGSFEHYVVLNVRLPYLAPQAYLKMTVKLPIGHICGTSSLLHRLRAKRRLYNRQRLIYE
ncbi:MAG: hypothetical protein P8X55_00890 [Desulfosarcinaceae bacterium]